MFCYTEQNNLKARIFSRDFLLQKKEVERDCVSDGGRKVLTSAIKPTGDTPGAGIKSMDTLPDRV